MHMHISSTLKEKLETIKTACGLDTDDQALAAAVTIFAAFADVPKDNKDKIHHCLSFPVGEDIVRVSIRSADHIYTEIR